jgi:hypothetical protein
MADESKRALPAVAAPTAMLLKDVDLKKSKRNELARSEQAQKRLALVGPELFPAYQQLVDFGLRVNATNIQYYFMIGSKLSQIFTKHQRNGLSALVAELGYSRDLVHKARRIYEVFGTEAAMTTFTQLRDKHGEPLTLSHIISLAQLDDPKERLEMAHKSVEESWSCETLAQAVQSKFGGKRTKGGHPFKAPSNLADCVDGLTRSSSDWVKRDSTVWSDFLSDATAAFSDTDANPEIYGKILEGVDIVATLRAAATAQERQLKALARRVSAVLDRTAEASAEVPAGRRRNRELVAV